MHHHSRARAFTLIELVVVILLLGILAAILMPHLTGATDRSRDAAAHNTLVGLRGQIDLFKSQHGEAPPQNGALWTLLQQSSDTVETQTPTPSGTRFGPYFRNNPVNPWNNLTAASGQTTDANTGWYYSATPTTYELRLRNVDGSINYNY